MRFPNDTKRANSGMKEKDEIKRAKKEKAAGGSRNCVESGGKRRWKFCEGFRWGSASAS